jgi:hypothetical protein
MQGFDSDKAQRLGGEGWSQAAGPARGGSIPT